MAALKWNLKLTESLYVGWHFGVNVTQKHWILYTCFRHYFIGFPTPFSSTNWEWSSLDQKYRLSERMLNRSTYTMPYLTITQFHRATFVDSRKRQIYSEPAITSFDKRIGIRFQTLIVLSSSLWRNGWWHDNAVKLFVFLIWSNKNGIISITSICNCFFAILFTDQT